MHGWVGGRSTAVVQAPKSNLMILLKLQIQIRFDATIPLSCQVADTVLLKDSCTKFFTIALFGIARN